MADYTSKELYMMNGGNTMYIYRDGFGDIYKATAAEEAEWSREVVANALKRVEQETNPTNLRFAVNDLIFHKYEDVEGLLTQQLADASPSRSITLATLLWTMREYAESFNIIYRQFLDDRDNCLAEFFLALIDFKNNPDARKFILACITGEDEVLKEKARTTIMMWSYGGMPELRAAGMLEGLKSGDKRVFEGAVLQLRQVLFL